MSYPSSYIMQPGLTLGPQSYDDIDNSREDIDDSGEGIHEAIWRTPSSYYAKAQPARSGIIRTDRGSAQFQVPYPYVRYTDFTAAMDNARRDNIRNQQVITSIERRLGSNIRNSIQQMQSASMMMPLLSFLQSPPKLDTINFQGGQTIVPEVDLKVQNSTLRQQDNTLTFMMMMMMMMSGGGGGASGYGEKGMGTQSMMMMMMMMMIVMGGGFGGTGTGTGTGTSR